MLWSWIGPPEIIETCSCDCSGDDSLPTSNDGIQLVTALEMIPCQQVTTGFNFTIALTRSRALYSWGCNRKGRLGLGHTRNELRPWEVIVESDNGAPDPVVQVSTTRYHVAAVTKAGRLFSWGDGKCGCLGLNNSYNELRPKQVEHGGFDELFIVSASAGYYRSAAIDSSGLVYTWGHNLTRYSYTLVLIDSLKAYRAVQVVACNWRTLVVLDNGQVHYFGNDKLWKGEECYKVEVEKGHKIQSIALGRNHIVMVTTRGAVFGFGRNKGHQLGVVDPSPFSTPSEVFAAVARSKGAARLHDGGTSEQGDNVSSFARQCS